MALSSSKWPFHIVISEMLLYLEVAFPVTARDVCDAVYVGILHAENGDYTHMAQNYQQSSNENVDDLINDEDK